MKVLKPLSWLFGQAVEIRHYLYAKGIKPSRSFSVPIVSVGNLVVGGTGKTPLIDALIREASKRKLVSAIVSRGYKSGIKTATRVPLKTDGVYFGDEPQLLAVRHPEVGVYVCPKRVDAVELAIRDSNPDIIFADDAFQHLAMKRNLDIVVLDATQESDDYLLLPAGKAREPWLALKRAQIVVLSRANLTTLEKVQRLRDNIIADFPHLKSHIFLMNYLIFDLKKPDGSNFEDKARVLLVSAIGNPKSFENLIKVKKQIQICAHDFYADHYRWSEAEWQKLMEKKTRIGADWIVVTEKDAARLSSEQKKDVLVAPLSCQFSEEAYFYDKIFSVLS
jgi:tetraacyldisaccharide 4'-kinase